MDINHIDLEGVHLKYDKANNHWFLKDNDFGVRKIWIQISAVFMTVWLWANTLSSNLSFVIYIYNGFADTYLIESDNVCKAFTKVLSMQKVLKNAR